MGTERESITKEVGSRIRYARKSRGMSMDELAQAIYKTRSAISKYENGQISVDIATLYDIANALKISIYDLLHRNTPDINQEYNAEMDPVHIFPINRDKENAVISRLFSMFSINLVQAKSSKNKGF